MSEAVGLTPDGELGGGQGALNGIDQLMMWYRDPRLGGLGRVDRGHLIEFDGVGATVQYKVWMLSHEMDSFRLVVHGSSDRCGFMVQ